MKKAMLYIMTACLSVMFVPGVLSAADTKPVASEIRTETPITDNTPVKVEYTVTNESPDPVTEKGKEAGKWTRDYWLVISGGALLLIIILLIILL
jgi:hypothetical protein